MDRDTFSHIRLWCPRPFGTYSQNKARGSGSGPQGASSSSSLCKAEPSPTGGRRSLDGNGAVEMMLGGQEEEEEEDGEEEEEEDAGSESENTPPDPELGSESIAPSPAAAAPPPPSSSCPPGPPSPPPSSGAQMEDGRVLLDTWYVIKPGNTKEKIAFFVAHQFSGAGLPRTSAMKVKGNWATDCSKAKRRRRCSSYDPPTRGSTQTSSDPHLNQDPPAPDTLPVPDQLPSGVSDATDLLSVAEMVALVEQRTAMALQGMVAVQGSQQQQHALLRSTVSDPTPMMFLSEEDSSSDPREAPASPIRTDQELEEEEEEAEKQQESCRVAQAIAHFESQNLEGRLLQASGCSGNVTTTDCAERRQAADSALPPPPPAAHAHGRGEVRIAFRVSSLSLDPRSQSEPASGRPRCMFMSCGGGGGGGAGQSGARAKEKITCDLYQLVSPSSRDPGALLLPKQDGGDHHQHADGSDPPQDSSTSSGVEKKAGGGASVGRERVTGFHVEVVVTGAVDQCVFYGKDSTENVQEETVCFAMPGGGGGGGGVGSSTDPPSSTADDLPPPPGQLFFLQEDSKMAGGTGGGGLSGMCSLDCSGKGATGPGDESSRVASSVRPDSPLADDSLCRLYRHVSHDFLEIRFQIQRLLEPRQYMLLLPDHIMVNIFSHLPTRALAALKCTCHDFKALIETFGVRAVDSRWNQDPLYRDDPCKQCKRQYERGDVSLCRWHPKPYHHDLPYGRSYWMCCRRTDKDTPGCRVGLHDNNWVQQPADGGGGGAQQPAARGRREDRRDDAR